MMFKKLVCELHTMETAHTHVQHATSRRFLIVVVILDTAAFFLTAVFCHTFGHITEIHQNSWQNSYNNTHAANHNNIKNAKYIC